MLWTRSELALTYRTNDSRDLHTAQKCSVSHRLIGAKDHASFQINMAEIETVTGSGGRKWRKVAL